MESVEFLAFGHEIVDALVGRVRGKDYGGRAATRVLRTDDVPTTNGWFFTYELEYDGVVRSKELHPVFVDDEGRPSPEMAAWLLARSSRLKREDPEPGEAVPTDTLDAALAAADADAATRLFERQAELTEVNRARLELERAKLTRYYEYRQRSARAKLASTQRTVDRLLASDNPDEIKIRPVWLKNLETADRMVESLAADRERRLRELAARDQVVVQQQMMTGAYVRIEPAAQEPDASS